MHASFLVLATGLLLVTTLGAQPGGFEGFLRDEARLEQYQGRTVPAATDRHLVDLAGLIDPVARFQIRRLLKQLEEDTEQRIAVVTYTSLEEFGWTDSMSARDDFARVLYDAWGLAGGNPELPGHLLTIGRGPRHVLYVTGDGFRLDWVRDLRNLLLDQLPNPIEDPLLSARLLELLQEADYTTRDHTGADWITMAATGLLAVFVYLGFLGIQKLQRQEPPPPPPVELAAPRRVGEPEREITVSDLYVDLRKQKKG